MLEHGNYRIVDLVLASPCCARRPIFDIIDDDSAVLSLVDALLDDSRRHAKLTRRILAAQQRLQELTGQDAWIAFLDIEQLVTDRVNIMLAVTASWAFHEGRRERQERQ